MDAGRENAYFTPYYYVEVVAGLANLADFTVVIVYFHLKGSVYAEGIIFAFFFHDSAHEEVFSHEIAVEDS